MGDLGLVDAEEPRGIMGTDGQAACLGSSLAEWAVYLGYLEHVLP